MHRIRTETVINAPPDDVWEILIDFARYWEWNPQTVSATGQAEKGASIPMSFVDLSKPEKIIKAVVRIETFDRSRELAWVGQLSFLFKGRHYFELQAQEGKTRLVHGEDISGLIPLLTSREKMLKDLKPGYEAVNRALASRAAQLSA